MNASLFPRSRERQRVDSPACFVLFLVLASALRAADMPMAAPAAALSPADTAFFETKIRPLLADKCYKCHSRDADKPRGGLLLDTREGSLHGGNSGAAIVPGKPDDSLLIQAVRYTDEDLQMPPKGEKLSDAQIADLTEWVRRGAPDPRTLVAKGSSATYGGVGKAHWSFQPVKKPEVPVVSDPTWCKTPVDNFVLAKLEANGMTHNPAADKATLIRRLYFDLIGLPPSVRDVQAFLNDNSPDAYEKLVDRLLGSQYYGEHWARYWLDIARYSDSKGDAKGQEDLRYPYAWTYRDYVINAFNQDKPYNQFVFEQLAADQLLKSANAKAQAKDKNAPAIEDQSVLAALGFLTLGNQFDGRTVDIIGDQIDVTTKAFLGLTVACARCHDHKFDPIPTKDYYSFYGVFANSVQPPELPTLQRTVAQTPEYLDYQAKSADLHKREGDLIAERNEIQRALRAAVGGKGKAKGKEAMAAAAKADPAANEKLKQIRKSVGLVQRQIGDLETTHPGAPARANAITDVPRSIDYPVLLRGELGNRGETAPRRFLEILSPDPKKRPEWHSGSGRPQLAAAIIDPKNPLTARVLVNRIWQQHWGAGFVATPDDLGNMSSPPTHPELLDYLAARFVEDGWSIKKLQRLIVLSAAYRQSSANNPKFAELDPHNQFLWRYNLRRLDFEQMHDALLTITGELDTKMGGKPVAISSDDFAKRRAIYTLIDRQNPPELLTQFDFPSPDVESGRRYETIVPQQALFLMNSPMVIEAARKLVEHPKFAALKTDDDRVIALYAAIYQRMPTPQEIALAASYVKANVSDAPAEDAPPLIAALPPQNPRAAQQAARIAAQQARAAAAKAARVAAAAKRGPYNTQVGGAHDTHPPLDAWTKLAHALFQSNEAMFYD